ncbi:MAG: PKD domain-containing protein [Bacteroidales bacterium]|jgi:chitodextrinase|nr:PKD domain-containing protein [Bacteroidales bacterium]
MDCIKNILFLFCTILVQGVWAQSYEVTPLSINTSYADEVAAVPVGNDLIYCSNRNQNVLISRTDKHNEYLFHLYIVHRTDSSKWSAPQILYKDLVPHAHQGPGSISADGNTLYFTVNSKSGNGIFITQREGNSWVNVRPFVHNHPDYKMAHPSLSRDGLRLFFASDMPGGLGGFDIYYCDWTPTGWGSPKNLGPDVNTPDDELYPFIQANGILYFSSRGHQSMGGLDIFSVRELNDQWGMRQQLEAPVNSESDDFAYSASDEDGLDGYFSSNRNGKTIDIFSFRSLFPVFYECNKQEENDYTYEFFDERAISLDTTTFYYEWDLGDGTVKKGEIVEHTYLSPGTYTVQLNIKDSLTGEFENRAADYLMEVLDIEQPYITTNNSVKAGEPLLLDASKTYLPEIEIDEYYWILGDGNQTKGEHITHTYTAPGTYQIRLGITGIHKTTGEKVKLCSYREIMVTGQ